MTWVVKRKVGQGVVIKPACPPSPRDVSGLDCPVGQGATAEAAQPYRIVLRLIRAERDWTCLQLSMTENVEQRTSLQVEDMELVTPDGEHIFVRVRHRGKTMSVAIDAPQSVVLIRDELQEQWEAKRKVG